MYRFNNVFRLLASGRVVTPARQPTEESQTNPQNQDNDCDISDNEPGDGDAATAKEMNRMEEEQEYEEEGEENPPEIQEEAGRSKVKVRGQY